ncbi:hypothetical protein ACWCL1_01370 [Ligilactobacillus sp. LYQ135]
MDVIFILIDLLVHFSFIHSHYIFHYNMYKSKYATHAYLIIMEVIIVVSVSWLTFKVVHYSNQLSKIILVGIISGLSKILSGFLRYLIEGLVVGMQGNKLIAIAVLSMPASVVTGIAMSVTVPLFFVILNKVMKIVVVTN